MLGNAFTIVLRMAEDLMLLATAIWSISDALQQVMGERGEAGKREGNMAGMITFNGLNMRKIL